MSGFGYLVSQILVCLLIAAALGFLIGWLLKSITAKRWLAEHERDWKRRLTIAESARSDLEGQLATVGSEHESALASLQGNADACAEALAAASSQVEGLEAETTTLRSDLVTAREHAGGLESKLTALAGLSGRAEAAEGERETLRERLQQAEQRAELLAGVRASLTDEHERQLEEARARSAALERDLAACRQTVAAVPVVDASASDELQVRLEARDARILELEKELAALDKLAGTALEPDDLKRIHGVGPVLEKLLNGVGVFTFRQIASWDDADIAWAAAKLDAFSGRIVRDNWVAQAGRLHQEKMAGGEA